MKTLRFIAIRTLFTALALWVISILVFVVIQLPEGDIVDALERSCPFCYDISRRQADHVRGYYGLDRGMLLQYGSWITAIISKLDFGPSMSYIQHGVDEEPKGTIRNLLAERLILTGALLAFTSILIWVVSVPIGVYLTIRRHLWRDRAFTFLGCVGLYVPDFLLALLLTYFLHAYFGWSVGGLFSPEYIDAPWSVGRFMDMLRHLIFPGIALGVMGVAKQARLLHENLPDELGRPYVTAARAKGVGVWKLVVKYPARVVATQLIRGFRALLPGLIGGSVIVSIVMSLPTLGSLMLQATYSLDMYLYGGIILVLCALGVVGVLILDLILAALDPRVRLTERVA